MFSYAKQINFQQLEHVCQIGGVRAKCGPPRLFMWPAKLEFYKP